MKNNNQQIAKAALLVMGLFALSRLLGVVRQMVIAAQFGTAGELDAYLAAARIPEMIFLVIAGGALGSAFIPAFASHLAQGDRSGAWRLASAAVNWVLILLTALAALIAILAPALVQTVIAQGLSEQLQDLTTELMQLMLVSSVIFGVSGIVMGTLNAQQHFLLPALAPSVYNLSIIGGTLLLGPSLGVRGIAVGVVIGAALHLAVQLPALIRHGARYTATLGLDLPSVREVGRLMAPRVLGTAIVQINFVVNNSLATTMGEGAVSAINYAWLLMLLPQGILAQAVGTAAFPTFAQQAAREAYDEMRSTLSRTLRTVFFLSLPSTVGLLVLGTPLVSLLFQRGAFDASSTAAVTWALSFFALGLIGHAGLEIVARAFYALHDTFTPVWVGSAAMALNLALSLTLPRAFAARGWMMHGGLALANSLATLLEMMALLALIRRRLNTIAGGEILTTVVKSGLGALAMGAVLWVSLALMPNAPLIVIVAGGVIVGSVVYLGAAAVLGAKELQAITATIRQRVSVRQMTAYPKILQEIQDE